LNAYAIIDFRRAPISPSEQDRVLFEKGLWTVAFDADYTSFWVYSKQARDVPKVPFYFSP